MNPYLSKKKKKVNPYVSRELPYSFRRKINIVFGTLERVRKGKGRRVVGNNYLFLLFGYFKI